MPAGQIERVEVITNPSAAFSPEGSGGVINLVTKPARKDTRSATVRATLGTEGRGGVNLSGAHSGPGLTMTGELGYRRFTGEASVTQDRARLDPGSGNFVTSRQDSELDNVPAPAPRASRSTMTSTRRTGSASELSYRDVSGDVDADREFRQRRCRRRL